MSVLNPLSSSGPSAEKRVYEPSMEEILASIRRIIADDQSLPGRGPSGRDSETTAPLQDVDLPRIDPARLDRAHVETSYGAPSHVEESQAGTLVEHAGAEPADIEPVHIAPLRGSISHSDPAPDAPHTAIDAFEPIPPDASLAPPPSEPLASGEPGLRSAGASHPVAHGAVTAPQYAAPGGPQPRDHADEPTPPEPTRHEPMSDASLFANPPAPQHASVPIDERSSRDEMVAARAYDQPVEPMAADEPAPPSAPGFSPLFSNATDSSVSSAFNMLAASRLAANSDEIMGLVREMIRPLLRSWLDDNLPIMVERMVRDEIERVARGGR